MIWTSPLGHPVRNTLYCYGGSIVDYDDEDVKDDNSDRGMDRWNGNYNCEYLYPPFWYAIESTNANGCDGIR